MICLGMPSVVSGLAASLVLALVTWSPGAVSSFQLTILHTNDVHGRFEQYTVRDGRCPSSGPESEDCYGGLARRATLVKRFRREQENVVLLDAGDQYQGTPWFFYYRGKAACHFMNMLDYDAMSLGNHEFDNCIEGLAPFLTNITFPVICANVNFDEEPSIKGLVNASVVLNVGGRRIGVVGYLTTDTPSLSKTGKLLFEDEVKAVRREVDRLTDDGVDIIIALGHAGFSTDKDIAKYVNGIDVVIGGHTNTFLYTGTPPSTEKPEGPYPLIVTQENGDRVLLLEGFAFGKYLGHLQTTFDDSGKLVEWSGNPILLDKSVEQDAETAKEVGVWGVDIQNLFLRVIGSTLVYLDGTFSSCRLHECTIGNLITDAMVDHYRASGKWSALRIAFMNGGGIRSSIEKGSITYEDVLQVMPFGNEIDIIQINGSNLVKILEHSVNDYSPERRRGRFLQVSGLKVTYDLTKENGKRVKEVTVVCEHCKDGNFYALNEDADYLIALPSYMVKGGDGYNIETLYKEHYNLGDIDSDILVKYIEKHSPIRIGVENRTVLIKDGHHNPNPRPAVDRSGADRARPASVDYLHRIYKRIFRR